MSVILQKSKSIRQYTGLSTDSKPTLTLQDVGHEFYETDTSDLWVWYGEAWKIPETVTTIPPIELGAAVGQASRVDFVGEDIIYIGEADPGTLEAATAWRIKKLTISSVDGDVITEWADGNANYDNSWTNHLSHTYS
mgnify:CR=1 FL=1